MIFDLTVNQLLTFSDDPLSDEAYLVSSSAHNAGNKAMETHDLNDHLKAAAKPLAAQRINQAAAIKTSGMKAAVDYERSAINHKWLSDLHNKHARSSWMGK